MIINAAPWTKEGESYGDESTRRDSLPGSQDEEKEEKVKSETNLFAIHDLANDYIHTFREKGRPKICRIIWAVILMTVIGISLYLIYTLLVDYFMYNSFNQSTTRWVENLTLPAITICSTNYVNYTALKADLSSTEEGKARLEAYNDFARTVAQFDRRGNVFNYLDFDAVVSLTTWESEAGILNIRFKNDISVMLVGDKDYTFQGWGRKIQDFRKVAFSTELGTCLELNDDSKFVQAYSGVDGGLSLDVDANIADYLPTTKTKGFVLFIRAPDETVMLNTGGYVIAPGTENFVKLSLRNITRLGGNYGSCENVPSKYARYSNHFNTIRECRQNQRITAMLNQCICIPWYVADRLYNANKTDLLKEMSDHVKKAQEEAEAGRDNTPTEEATESSGGSNSDSGDNNSGGTTRRKRGAMNFAIFEDLLARVRRQDGSSDDGSAGDDSAVDGSEATTEAIPTTSTPIIKTDPAPGPEQSLFESEYEQDLCGFVKQTACDAVISQLVKRGNVFTNCPEPCAYSEWGVELMSTIFPPTEEYLQTVMEFGGKYKDTPPTMEYARENIARIHIYYDDIKVEEISQEAAYDWASFVGELGGIGDLFVGFSFFTLFQLIEIFIAFMVRCIQKRYNKRKEKLEEEKDEIELESVKVNEEAEKQQSPGPSKVKGEGEPSSSPSQGGVEREGSPNKDSETDPSQLNTEHVYALSNF